MRATRSEVFLRSPDRSPAGDDPGQFLDVPARFVASACDLFEMSLLVAAKVLAARSCTVRHVRLVPPCPQSASG
jgi:hypothetical protein